MALAKKSDVGVMPKMSSDYGNRLLDENMVKEIQNYYLETSWIWPSKKDTVIVRLNAKKEIKSYYYYKRMLPFILAESAKCNCTYNHQKINFTIKFLIMNAFVHTVRM